MGRFRTDWIRQHWARLVAEGLVIFASVTISLAADDWRERRDEGIAEKEVLALIRDDLLADSIQLETVRSPLTRNVRGSVWLTEHWRESGVALDSLRQTVTGYAFGAFYRPQRAVFTGLVESDRLRVIEDDRLRGDLTQYFLQLQPQLVDILDLHMAQGLVLLELLGPHFLVFRGGSPGSLWPPSADGAQLLTSVAGVWNDSGIYNKAAFVGALAQFSVGLVDEIQASNQQLRKRIEIFLR